MSGTWGLIRSERKEEEWPRITSDCQPGPPGTSWFHVLGVNTHKEGQAGRVREQVGVSRG